MIGPGGPVLLDAEVAWFGDPAFDVAFCLNHLAIKSRILADARSALKESIQQFVDAYFNRVNWEPQARLERRTAALLPALALARVDGKSPVTYLRDAERRELRADSRAALFEGPTTLSRAFELLHV
jgi:hypothetical protein